jgi:hypothetical protein
MKKLLIVALTIFCLPFSSWATTYYMRADGSAANKGAATGPCGTVGNTMSITTHNAQTFSGDDIITLCNDGGNYTTTLVIPSSGTSGHVITYLFGSGAKFSAAHWNQSGANGDAAIYANGLSYLTIDGGTNGTIEATDNGTTSTFGGSHTTALANHGVKIEGGTTGSTIKNLIIIGLYHRTADSDDVPATVGTNSIIVTGVLVSVEINNNTASWAGNGVYIGYQGSSSALKIHHNTLSAQSVNISVGDRIASSVLDDLQIYNNDISQNAEWQGVAAIHCELVHPFAVASGSSITNYKFYNNYLHGNLGTQSTAFSMPEGWIPSALIYNNLFESSGSASSNGDLYLKGADGAKIVNNTFYTTVSSPGIAIAVGEWAGGEAYTFSNNLIYGYANGVYDNRSASPYASITSNYNIFYPASMTFRFTNGSGKSFAQWQASGYDANGTQSQPILSGAYIPDAADTVAKWTGTATGQLSSADKAGVSWHAPPSIGSYEYVAGGDTTAPTVTFSIPSSNVGYVVPLTFSCTDDTAVTGYCVQESGSVGSCSWVGSAPANFIFATQGSKNLYAWCRDVVPNTSGASTDSVTVTSGRGVTFTVR